MTGPQPLTKQRSPWERFPRGDIEIFGVLTLAYRRRVHDGDLVALVADEPDGWHVSVSHQGAGRRESRYPSWDELAHARYELLPHDLDFVMHLPPPAQYVAVHDTTFHLHEHPPRNGRT